MDTPRTNTELYSEAVDSALSKVERLRESIREQLELKGLQMPRALSRRIQSIRRHMMVDELAKCVCEGNTDREILDHLKTLTESLVYEQMRELMWSPEFHIALAELDD